ncbi:hypothetical protein ACFFRR_008028 [Megaselia abdita]
MRRTKRSEPTKRSPGNTLYLITNIEEKEMTPQDIYKLHHDDRPTCIFLYISILHPFGLAWHPGRKNTLSLQQQQQHHIITGTRNHGCCTFTLPSLFGSVRSLFCRESNYMTRT